MMLGPENQGSLDFERRLSSCGLSGAVEKATEGNAAKDAFSENG
jgi:hypothetical protein